MDMAFFILAGLIAVWVIFMMFWRKIENDKSFKLRVFFREEYKYYKYCIKNKDNFQVKEKRLKSYLLAYNELEIAIWGDGSVGIFKGNDCVFCGYFEKESMKLKETFRYKIEQYEKENKNKRNKSYNLNS